MDDGECRKRKASLARFTDRGRVVAPAVFRVAGYCTISLEQTL